MGPTIFSKSKFFERLRLVLAPLQRSFRISENTFLIILAVIIGLLGGLGNYAFRKVIEFVHWAVFEQSEQLFGYSMDEWSLARLAVVFCPVVGGLLVIPLWHWFGKDLKGGFSGFLERVNLRGAKLELRPIFTRGFGSAITIGTGGSAGQEGPIAMIGGAIGSQFGQLFKMSGDRLKVLVACGAAAGVAATFNAPIAGVFFAQEIVLLSAFEMSSFTSIVISSGMATVVSRALLGNHSEITAPLYVVQNYWELVLYVFLGLLIGALAALFIETHFRIKDRFAALKIPRLVKPVVGGLLVGVVGCLFPQVFGNGYEFIETVLMGDQVWSGPTWYLLGALIIVKALATSITLGSGLPGGLFAPCLYLGAVTGGFFGQLAAMLLPQIHIAPGAYALVGMGAFLSAATHAPMTAIFLLFEITDSYEVIVPIMLSCVIGTAVARHFKKDSLETVELSRSGIDLEAGKERNIMKSLQVGDVMVREVETIPEHMTLGQFAKFIAKTQHTNFPLINAQGELTGIISVQDFMGVVFERDLMNLVVVKELA
ncbi:MAG: chloride channel protein, partial [Desulfuromonadales bacterium]|nr:chloride channel protein [Desulfuromonadales bacterium]